MNHIYDELNECSKVGLPHAACPMGEFYIARAILFGFKMIALAIVYHANQTSK